MTWNILNCTPSPKALFRSLNQWREKKNTLPLYTIPIPALFLVHNMLKRRFSKGSYWDKRVNLAHQQVVRVPSAGQVISPPTAGPEPGPEKGGKWGGNEAGGLRPATQAKLSFGMGGLDGKRRG